MGEVRALRKKLNKPDAVVAEPRPSFKIIWAMACR